MAQDPYDDGRRTTTGPDQPTAFEQFDAADWESSSGTWSGARADAVRQGSDGSTGESRPDARRLRCTVPSWGL